MNPQLHSKTDAPQKGESEDPFQIGVSLVSEDPRWDTVIPTVEGFATCALDSALAHLETDVQGEVSVLLADDARLQSLNAEFRNKNKPTNVLSFSDGSEVDNVVHVGGIALSLDRLIEESKATNISLEHHFLHLFVHGLLHLLGYDHIEDAEAEEMEALEITILADLGVANPYELRDEKI